MADVIPFKCCRPTVDLSAAVAAAPYDTFSRSEAAAEIAKYPHSFLRIDKPAALLPPTVDEYAPEVYAKARELFDADFANGVFIQDSAENTLSHPVPSVPPVVSPDQSAPIAYYYIYRLIQGQHTQTGIVACAPAADYQNQIIKRHENTRSHKQQDRVDHINALEAHTGPVLLTYQANAAIDSATTKIAEKHQPLFDFTAPDGVRHQVWRVTDEQTAAQIKQAFANVDSLYIADGHHRAAAAAVVAEQRSEQPDAQHFLVAIFPDNQMQVLDYNRVISNLNGYSPAELLELTGQIFTVSKIGPEPYRPQQRGEFGMYLDGSWYRLSVKPGQRSDDPVEGMDIAILHSKLLDPVLGITDPRSNPNIAYVGGARGLQELATRAGKTSGVAFSLYPCSLAELFAVADVGRLMPPKSTWFEPKPRSGLFIHKL